MAGGGIDTFPIPPFESAPGSYTVGLRVMQKMRAIHGFYYAMFVFSAVWKMGFDSRAGQIRYSFANRSPPLPCFFGAG